MRIRLDAKVRTSDGHDAGHVRRAVWDPATNEIRSFIVSTGGLLGHEALVSREILERASQAGDRVTIDLTKDELDALDHYEEQRYAPPPLGWTPPATYDFPAGMYLLPIEPVNGSVNEPATEPDRIERPLIAKGMRVKDPDGKDIGVVKELRIDDMTGELRSIVVQEHDFLGRGATTEISADHLDVGGGEVHLVEGAAAPERKRH